MSNDNTNNQQQRSALNAADFLGNYLKKEDIERPMTVNVVDVWSESVQEGERPKLLVKFKGLRKPLILNKTNIKRFAQMFNSGDPATWRGPITLYVDAHVEFGGRQVGGIRVKPAMQKPLADENRYADGHYRNGEATSVEDVIADLI